MLSRLRDLLERSHQRRRHRRLIEEVDVYRRQVLEPRGYGEFELSPFAESRHRLVFLGPKHVWKFYRGERRKPLNAVAAAKRLESGDIPAPRVLFSDTTRESRDRYRLSCIVMTRVESRTLGREVSRQGARDVGAFLARLHSIRSEAWGSCHRPREGDYFERHFLKSLKPRLETINAWIHSRGMEPLREPLAWFEARRERLTPVDGRYCLVMQDTHSRNLRLGLDGKICLLDLDSVRFLDFPVDLSQFLALEGDLDGESFGAPVSRFMRSIAQHRDDFLDAYFSGAPSGFYDHWERTREAYSLLELILTLYGIVRRHQGRYGALHTLNPGQIDRLGLRHYTRIKQILNA